MRLTGDASKYHVESEARISFDDGRVGLRVQPAAVCQGLGKPVTIWGEDPHDVDSAKFIWMRTREWKGPNHTIKAKM